MFVKLNLLKKPKPKPKLNNFFGCLLIAITFTSWAKNEPMSIYVVKKQAIFTVDLKSNPTTGYRWQMISYDKALLKFMKRKYVSPKTHLIGSGGIESFKFQSLKTPIDTVIKFKYVRPWEKSEGIYQEVHVKTK